MNETERLILEALGNIQSNQVLLYGLIKDIYNRVEIIDVNLNLNTGKISDALAPANKEFDFKDALSTPKKSGGLKIESVAILNEDNPEFFAELLKKGVDAVEPEQEKQLQELKDSQFTPVTKLPGNIKDAKVKEDKE